MSKCQVCGKTPPFPGGTRCQRLDCGLINWTREPSSKSSKQPSCDCTKYNGGQCYNCLNGHHEICGNGQGRCSRSEKRGEGETPRTDEVWEGCLILEPDNAADRLYDHARQLERELAFRNRQYDDLFALAEKDANALEAAQSATAATTPNHRAYLDRIRELEEALEELVRLKDMKDRTDNAATTDARASQLHADYLRRKPLAWAAARAAISSTTKREGK